MQLLQVIPLTQSIHSEVLTYFSVKNVTPGQLVTAPLRKKEIVAMVASAESVIDMKSQLRGAKYQIRNILEVHEGQIFSSEFLATCSQIKNFYATSTGRILEKFTPTFILKDLQKYSYIRENKKKSPSKKQLLQRPWSDRVSYYKTLIREKLITQESLHVICSTVQESEKLFNELQKNNQHCFLLHGSLGVKQRRETYTAITNLAKPSVLISTGVFVDTYQFQKSTLVIERESSDYYYSVRAPFVDTRVFIETYAENSGMECIWADTALRPETWHKKDSSNTEIIEPFTKKIVNQDTFHIVNQHTKKPQKQTDIERIAELTTKKKFSCMSKQAEAAIKKSIQNNESIFVFATKKSLAPNIVCRDCGNMAQSPKSGHPYSLYIKTHPTTNTKERIFVCNTTGESLSAFDTCQFCQSWNMQSLGIGTQGVFQELSVKFPNTTIYIMDSNHAKTKKQIKEIVSAVNKKETAVIVVGTQMALSHLSNIDTAIISSLDSFFARMSHSIHTQVISLLIKISEMTHNPIILQSRNITEDSLPILKNGLYREYVEAELSERKQFNYPPFSTLCVIKRTVNKKDAKKQFIQLNQIFNDYNPHIMTHPALSKLQVQLIIILELPYAIWNRKSQDLRLREILSSFDRKTEIHINPKDLI